MRGLGPMLALELREQSPDLAGKVDGRRLRARPAPPLVRPVRERDPPAAAADRHRRGARARARTASRSRCVPPQAEIDVRVAGLRKRYGDVTAVDGVDLEIGRGEFFTLLGPSGSGKTTTLRVIAGFERPDEGTVELGGRDVSRLPPYARDVNTVFQDYALFPHMTVQENVEYGLRVKKVPRAERRQRADEALELVQLEGLRRSQARTALRRPAAARRTRSRDRQPAAGAAPRRASRRARPQAPPGAPGRAEADPAGARDHVRLRHARPGGGAHDERPPRGVQPRQDRADRRARRGVRASGQRVHRRLRRRLERARAEAAAASRCGRRRSACSATARSRSPASASRGGRFATSSTSASITRYHVELDAGGELTVVSQNLESGSSEVLERQGSRVRLVWRPEHVFVIETGSNGGT